MPPCPESIALMLATVRIGAIHSIVFAGFGAQALGDRIAASGSRVVFAADVTYRKGQNVPLLADRRARRLKSGRRIGGTRASCSSAAAARAAEPHTLVGRLPARRRGPGLRATRSWSRTSRRSSSPPPGTTAKPKLGDSHARRLPGARRHDGQVVLRAPADRRVVGDVRHRLDRRPQLHGVRAAARSAAPPIVFEGALDYPRPTPTGGRRSRSSASPASSRRRPRCAC